MNLYRKLFLDGDWTIAIRRKVQGDDLISYEKAFNPIPNTKKYWFADPLLFQDNGKEYLFCEAFDKKMYKGILGVFDVNNGEANNFRTIIEEKYHLSYPCVFKYNNNYFMIPETGENNTINLYRSIDFPNKWKLECVLTSGHRYADPTVFVHHQNVYFIVYNESPDDFYNVIYKINMSDYTISEVDTIRYKTNIGRPAGFFISDGNKGFYRPAQNSRELYGKNIILYKENFDNNTIVENEFSVVDNSKVRIGDRTGVDRIHTYSCTDLHEAIDYCNFHFVLNKRFEILKRERKVKQRNRV